MVRIVSSVFATVEPDLRPKACPRSPYSTHSCSCFSLSSTSRSNSTVLIEERPQLRGTTPAPPAWAGSVTRAACAIRLGGSKACSAAAARGLRQDLGALLAVIPSRSTLWVLKLGQLRRIQGLGPSTRVYQRVLGPGLESWLRGFMSEGPCPTTRNLFNRFPLM